MIELIFAYEVSRDVFAVVGVYDDDVALDRTAFHPTGQINWRPEIMLG